VARLEQLARQGRELPWSEGQKSPAALLTAGSRKARLSFCWSEGQKSPAALLTAGSRKARLSFPLGAHLVTPRRGYVHHGIYVGDGNVVHYAGLAGGLHRGPVEEVPLARFTRGRPVWIKSHGSSNFDRAEVLQRARSRVGEDCYQLLTNNCEHFCEWCLHGEHRSYQVEALLTRLHVLFATARFVAQSASLLGRVGLRQRRGAADA
jgi:hypothetical protein